METVTLWFLTFAPITMSPGPSNLLLASTSAAHGVRRALLPLAGIVSVFVLQIIAVGVGIDEVLSRYPAVFEVFKYIGAAFMLYLAWLFWRSSGIGADEAAADVGFREGALLQFFNFKALSVPLIMFTQFANPQTSSFNYVLGWTLALLVLIIGSLLIWTVGGSTLKRFFRSEFGRKYQGKLFGVLLVAVAIWMLTK